MRHHICPLMLLGYHAVPCRAAPCRVVLICAVIRYALVWLCCARLCYVVLCCAMRVPAGQVTLDRRLVEFGGLLQGLQEECRWRRE